MSYMERKLPAARLTSQKIINDVIPLKYSNIKIVKNNSKKGNRRRDLIFNLLFPRLRSVSETSNTYLFRISFENSAFSVNFPIFREDLKKRRTAKVGYILSK